jgi:hypothetical protein
MLTSANRSKVPAEKLSYRLGHLDNCACDPRRVDRGGILLAGFVTSVGGLLTHGFGNRERTATEMPKIFRYPLRFPS